MNDENEPILIGQVEDIDQDTVENFEYEDVDYAIYHLSSGFFATQGNCVCEESILLSEGNIDNEEIECASCGKTFNIVSGDPISDPGSKSLRVYDITTDDKDLYLNL